MLTGRGDRLTVSRVTPQQFPQAELEQGGVSGDWESEDGGYQLSVEGDDRLCTLSAQVANSIFCSIKYNDQRGWALHGGIASTLMLPPPHLRALESRVTAMLGSITDITRSGNLLLLTSAGDTHSFHRAARPGPATRENINWMKRMN